MFGATKDSESMYTSPQTFLKEFLPFRSVNRCKFCPRFEQQPLRQSIICLLSENSLHRLIESDTIRRCGLVGVCVALLKEGCR